MRLFTFIFFFILSIVPCSADTFIVDHNGFKDFTSIQAAINYSWHGDTIIVNPGTYNESIYFNGRAITLTSRTPNDSNIVTSTIINVSSGYSVTFDFAENSYSVLTGFTILDSILCYSSSPTITKNVIRNCSGVGIEGQYGASPIILYNTINSNGGGGIYGCDGTITSNLISENIGGVTNCNGTISYNNIVNNSNTTGYSGYGGGLSGCNGTIIGNTISGNSAKSHNGHSEGGGLYSCNGMITNNRIIGNISEDNTFTGTHGESWGGGLSKCNGTIANNIISGNLATSTYGFSFGGGLYQCSGNINNNIISGNKSSSTNISYGGGLFQCNYKIINNDIIGNIAGHIGGALYNCNAYVKNNIISFNSANSIGGIYGLCDNSYNNLWMNAGGNWGNGAKAGIGDIAVNPLFASDGYWIGDIWINGDYHLKSEAGRWDPNSETWVIDNATSFCIDAGDPCDPIEYEPNPNGGLINMGAYGGTVEASKSIGISGPKPKPFCKEKLQGDVNGDCKVDFADFAIMASHWMECNLEPPEACWE